MHPIKLRPTYLLIILLLPFLLLSCRHATPSPTPSLQVTFSFTPPTPAPSDIYQSSGGGEPRSSGYWLVWNSCMPNNQSETARANGGREAGWLILDDLLQDPGLLLGQIQLTTCQEAANLLQGLDLDGASQPDDAAYPLAAQLLVAQLNLAAGAETCRVAEIDVQKAQLLLLSLKFTGRDAYLPVNQPSETLTQTQELTQSLSTYNIGSLCQ